MAAGFLFELPAREQTEAQRLPGRHRCLLGLELVGDVYKGPRRRGDRHSVAPYGADFLAVRPGVKDNTGWAADAPVTARDKQVNLVRDVVAQLEQRER
ncbi:MAG: hypothetical protein WEA81_02535, partial [Dehalococcoidia bacterium]